MARKLIKYTETSSMKWFNEILEHYAMSRTEGYAGNILNSAVCSIYPFSNENLDETYDIFNPEGKNILTVGSSGDQVIWALSRGANKVTLMDANPMSLAYTELKLSAIKNLAYDECVRMFSMRNFLDHKMYAKVSHDLSPQVREFWDMIFSNISLKYELVDHEYHIFQYIKRGGMGNCSSGQPFISEETFNNAKANLGKCEMDFKCAELQDFARNLDNEYDIMLLSNISDYVSGVGQLFPQLFALSQHLTDDGVIEMNYSFGKSFNFSLFLMTNNFAIYCGDDELRRLNEHSKASKYVEFKHNGFVRRELTTGAMGREQERPVITYVNKSYLQEKMKNLKPNVLEDIAKLLIKKTKNGVYADEFGM